MIKKVKVKNMFRYCPNLESSVRVFIVFTIFYSMTCSVLSQEFFNEQLFGSKPSAIRFNSDPNFDLAVPDYKGNVSYFADNVNQTSLRISAKESTSLLGSYLTKESRLLSQASISIPDMFLNPSIIKSSDVPNPSLYDNDVWQTKIARKYYGAKVSMLSKGVAHIKIRPLVGRRRVNINILEINRNVNPKLTIAPAFATSTLSGKKKVSGLVSLNKAIAGVNASFFKQTNGVPLGFMMKKGEIISGSIYDRVAMGITSEGFKMDRVILNGKIILSDGSEISVASFNQPRMLATKTIIYNSKWSYLSPTAPKYGINVLIKQNEVKLISANPIKLDKNSLVISGPKRLLLPALSVGSAASVNITSSPDWSEVKEAIGGGPYLVKNGNLFVDAKAQKLNSISGLNPRTAVGYTKENVAFVMTVDGRQENSSGLTLYELAKMMKKYGCYNAMNLDGGSSTQMVIKNKVVNTPLIEGGAYVSNGLIVKEEKI